jgi:hypothetical protein
MEEKKYQIFVSSTYTDLVKAREKIIETILKLYHFPVGMEMFSADDAEQWEIIKDTIDVSDYYIVIIGHRYGSVTSDGISFTEKEYDYANEKDVPILAFIRKRDVATKPHERDDDGSKSEKLERFIEKAKKSKMCEFWDNDDDLSTKVAIALPKIFRKTPRIGWVRSDKAFSPEISEELAKLSRENRDLRDETEKLKAKIENRKPNFNILINDSSNLKFSYVSNEKMEITFNNKKIPITFMTYPEPIDPNTIPNHLKAYLSQTEISEYNEKLPSNDEVDKFNQDIERYWRIKEMNYDLSISVENNGSAKANEVFIDVLFPTEIMVLGSRDLDEFELPKSPLPDNPIKKAEEKNKKAMERRNKPFLGLSSSFRDFSLYNRPMNGLADTIANLNVRRNYHIDLENNKLMIKIDSLLHTRTMTFEQFILVPLKSGEHDIDISIICEEYDGKVNYTIPVIINNESANSVE